MGIKKNMCGFAAILSHPVDNPFGRNFWAKNLIASA